MNENGGNTYFWSWATGAPTALSLQDMIFALGAIFTAVFTVYTCISNDRKNKALAAEARRQTDILEQMAEGTREISPNELATIITHLQKNSQAQK
ncbi:hypothetical protein [Pectobacterium brasiliense]|uniref:hypothetical protein n=1 Tax=Pectobacterium brasiliense TaxID=180957 RepID=UPI00300E68C9